MLTSEDAGVPDGWHAYPTMPEHVMRDALYINGLARATVEAFSEDGPFYGNAIAPNGERLRFGAGSLLEDAQNWCERVTGYRVDPRRAVLSEHEGRGE